MRKRPPEDLLEGPLFLAVPTASVDSDAALGAEGRQVRGQAFEVEPSPALDRARLEILAHGDPERARAGERLGEEDRRAAPIDVELRRGHPGNGHLRCS